MVGFVVVAAGPRYQRTFAGAMVGHPRYIDAVDVLHRKGGSN
jgi:hypothetical protein